MKPATEHIIPDTVPGLPAPQAAFPIGDILKYLSLIMQLIALIKGGGNLAVGESEDVPPLKVVVGGKHLTLANDKLTRTA